ncbi:MAG: hypothetical protein JNK29_18075, partial [Anaerolineales bacterium]|nr:hypothetical protein [Anaerolineales bacterium]
DYSFLESLTRRADRTEGEEKARLIQRRDLILEITRQVDEAAKARLQETTALLKKIAEARDIDQALRENAHLIDDAFVAVLNENIAAAQKAGRMDVAARLNQVGEGINRLMEEAAPPEIKLINQLLELPSEADAEAALKAQPEQITQDLVNTLQYLGDNMRQNGRPELAERLDHLYGVALGEMMAANWKK